MIFMIGAFPPPVRGMPMVNAAVRDRLLAASEHPCIIDLAAPSIELSVAARARRFLRVITGLGRFALRTRKHDCAYISVSGGFGQVYDTAFATIARMRGARVHLHHHSFAYLRRGGHLPRLLCRAAGPNARHVVQSPGMAARLRALYGVQHVHAVSNAAFLSASATPPSSGHRELDAIGHLSNLTAAKGVFEFLDLMAELQREGIELTGLLAGPFQDPRTEREVRSRLEKLRNVEWLGPVHGPEKDAFLARIGVMVFPTRYDNETEGIVNHEAMRSGVPVIAFGRGCIPEVVDNGAGLVVDPEDDFVARALDQIRRWWEDREAYAQACDAASAQFTRLRQASETSLEQLLAAMRHPGPGSCSPSAVERNSGAQD